MPCRGRHCGAGATAPRRPTSRPARSRQSSCGRVRCGCAVRPAVGPRLASNDPAGSGTRRSDLGWVPWTRPREPVHCGACGRRQAARVGDRRDPSSTRPHASARWLRLRVRPPGRRHSSRLPARRRSPGSGPPREEFAGFDTPGRCSTSVRNFSAAVAPRYRASTAANPPLRVSRGVVISRVPSCASSRRAARPSCRWARSAAHVVPPVPSFLPLAA